MILICSKSMISAKVYGENMQRDMLREQMLYSLIQMLHNIFLIMNQLMRLCGLCSRL